MKKIIRNTAIAAIAIFGGAALTSFTADVTEVTTVESVQQGPKIVFEEKEFNFGSIKQGDKVEHTFQFKNEGDAPLKINHAKGSCGCTVPKWPQEPILPGQSGEIHVVFNSAGKSGRQTKSVTLQTNVGETPVVLYIKGEVIVPSSITNQN
jgi:hypothetical protein